MMAQQRAQTHVESLRLLSGGWLHPILANHDVSASKRLIERPVCAPWRCARVTGLHGRISSWWTRATNGQ